jgi:thiaminase
MEAQLMYRHVVHVAIIGGENSEKIIFGTVRSTPHTLSRSTPAHCCLPLSIPFIRIHSLPTLKVKVITMSAQAFWDKTADLIAVTEKHPFLVAMVDGTLDIESFRYYVVQDALYLADFADCLRRLANNAGISSEDSERLNAFAKGAAEAELSLHRSFFVEWNISAEGAEQMPNCLLYTSYMKRVVATRCHAEGLAVMLPCFWVYMHVGKCMLSLREELGSRYV